MPAPLPLQFVGVGCHLPARVVTNEEVAARCGVSASWIEKNQGVRERRWVDGETASEMGASAAREALRDADMDPADLDLILNCSGTQEQAIPDGAALVQRALGLGDSGIACMSLHVTCLSFVAGVDVAASLLATGRYQRILLVSSDISSCALDWSRAETCSLFGDLAAAAVVIRTPEGEPSCVHAARFETYGDGADFTTIPGGGTRRHPNATHTRFEDNLFHMDGRRVFRMVLKKAPAFLEALQPGLSRGLGDIRLLVPHQASRLALHAHATRYGFDETRTAATLDRLGNCVAASIPATLYEAVRAGRIARGDKILLLGTGAGLSMGGVILTW
ncbi:MAG: ketoacyl-ACP synthase III [Deltaproteobacteria bacterium]|nr:ketoacyl-ACP synthase III [Deltaproteobacteria bacterium]